MYMKGKDKKAKEYIKQLSTSQKVNHILPEDFIKSLKLKTSYDYLKNNYNDKIENNSDEEMNESEVYSTINIDNEYDKF